MAKELTEKHLNPYSLALRTPKHGGSIPRRDQAGPWSHTRPSGDRPFLSGESIAEQKAPEKKAPQRWYRYGYFVRKANGVLSPAGDDNSLSPDVYKIGDTEAGGPGRVVDIIKGKRRTSWAAMSPL